MEYPYDEIEKEYRRLKRKIHTSPILQEDSLLMEIEDFGRQYGDMKKYYNTLKRKFWWHRKIHPRNISIGRAPVEWSEQQTPLVSVIVPNYGHAAFLSERIDSILCQTFQNFELIILDDCSPDGSRDIIAKYNNHPRVAQIVFNEENSGNTFLQWERGIALARGKYIWIAESDDYADEVFLDSAMAMFFLHEDCVMVRTGSYLVNEKGRIMLKDWDWWKEDESVRYYRGEDYIRHNMLHFNFIYNASMVVFRKDVFGQIDKSYQRLRFAGDWLCWIEMLTQGPICEMHRKLNYFRQHQNKVSVRSSSTSRGIIDQIRVLAYTIRKIRMSPFRRMMVRGEQYEASVKWFYYGHDFAMKKECLMVLHNELNATSRDYMWYKIISKLDFLPFIPSRKNDKYK